MMNLCNKCEDGIKTLCKKTKDTAPMDCGFLKKYLLLSNKITQDGYSIHIKYSEINAVYYLSRNNIIITEYHTPMEMMGDILLRKEHPQWYDRDGHIKA